MPLGLIAAGASAVGGIGNAISNMSAGDRANAVQNQALQSWLNVNIPDPATQKLALQQFVQTGELHPSVEQAIKQDPTAFTQVVQSATDKAAQNQALQSLQDIGNSGGLRLQDKAALQDAMLKSQTEGRTNSQNIAAKAAQQGTTGGGFEEQAQLSNGQNQANQDAQNSLSVASQAQNRALQSIQEAGTQATQMNQQDLAQQNAQAQATDAINKFNATNLQDVNQRNTASSNYAQQQNLAEQQKVSDANTNLSNQQQEYNKSLAQQQFTDQAQKAAGETGQYNNIANTDEKQGAALGNAFSNVGGGISSAATNQGNQDYWTNYFNKQKSGSV